MKRITAFLLILVFAICFTACGGNNGDVERSSGKQTDPVSENGTTADSGAPIGGAVIGDYTVTFSEALSHGDLHFLAPNNTEKAGYDQVYNLSCSADGDTLFTIRLVYFSGKGVDEVMEGTDSATTNKTVGGVEYLCFEDSVNGETSRTYVYCFEGTTYAISFSSRFDTAGLEAAFLANVRFEKE